MLYHAAQLTSHIQLGTLIHLAELDEGRLTASPIIDPQLTRRVVLAYSADRPVSRSARVVGDVLISEATKLVEEGIWVGNLIDLDRS